MPVSDEGVMGVIFIGVTENKCSISFVLLRSRRSLTTSKSSSCGVVATIDVAEVEFCVTAVFVGG